MSVEVVTLVPSLWDPDAPGGPALVGSRCPACGEVSFPLRPVCPACKREGTERIHLSRTGRLYSFTVCFTAPQGWLAPYYQAYVELPEGVRVFSLIADEIRPVEDGLKIGMPVELISEVARTGPSGETYVTYKFRPASAPEEGEEDQL
jgi:uncharacterized OB-fold protein